MVRSKQAGIKMIYTLTVVSIIIGPISGVPGVEDKEIDDPRSLAWVGNAIPSVPSIPGVEDKGIDCGCPETCHGDALQKKNAVGMTCEGRITWLMQHHDNIEANACMYASKLPTRTEEENAAFPCDYEECHPEGCNSYLETVEEPKIDCGCPDCNEEALNIVMGPNDFTCKERIQYGMHRWEVSQWEACDKEFSRGSCPDACDPKTCGSGGSTLSEELPEHAPWKEGREPPGWPFTAAPTTAPLEKKEIETTVPEVPKEEPSEEKETETTEAKATEAKPSGEEEIETTETKTTEEKPPEEKETETTKTEITEEKPGKETDTTDAKVSKEEPEKETATTETKVAEDVDESVQKEAPILEEDVSEKENDIPDEVYVNDKSQLKSSENESMSNVETLVIIVIATVGCVALLVALHRMYQVRMFRNRANHSHESPNSFRYSDEGPNTNGYSDAPIDTPDSGYSKDPMEHAMQKPQVQLV